MTERKRILDIGIERGGNYISDRDDGNTLRIGLDLRIESKDVSRYEIIPLLADGAGYDFGASLPLKSDSFDHIDVILPVSTLWNGLYFYDSLWKEFERVLKEEGDIEIVADFPCVDKEMERMSEAERNQIINKGRSNGFLIEADELGVEQIREYGTFYSKRMAIFKESGSQTKIYLIKGKKLSSLK